MSVPSGDQNIDFFYDATGAIVAILQWASKPPCQGACQYQCVAGAPNLDPSALSACASDGPAGSACEVDGGAD